MTDFGGKKVIIIGATGGIGASVGQLLRQQGAITVNCARSYAAQPPGDVDFCQSEIDMRLDITDQQQVDAVFAAVVKGLGSIDAVINTAGILRAKSFIEISEAEWDNMFNVNLKGVFFVCQAAARQMMVQHSGSIVNLASISGQVGGVLAGADYAASKAGVIGLTKSLAKFGAVHGFRANSVAPGAVETDMLDIYRDIVGTAEFAAGAAQVPLQRWARPEEVAQAILFLASDKASYITGQCLNVNGGELMFS